MSTRYTFSFKTDSPISTDRNVTTCRVPVGRSMVLWSVAVVVATASRMCGSLDAAMASSADADSPRKPREGDRASTAMERMYWTR